MNKRFLLPFLIAILLASGLVRVMAATTATVNVAISIGYAVTFNPSSLSFPITTVGTSISRNITVTNNGTSTINFGIAFIGSNTADFSQTNDCGGTLAPGNVPPPPQPPHQATCQVAVTFTPSSTAAQSVELAVNVTGGRTYLAAIGGQGSTATPVSITLNPAGVTIPDNTLVGTVLSTATVRMSDGSTYGGSLTSSNPLFGINGLNIILAAPLSSSLDGTAQVTTISTP